MKFLSLLFLFLLSSCVSGSLDYVDDRGFLPAVRGNSPEYLVMVDGYYCVDVSGKGGMCSTRIRNLKDSIIQIMPQNYAYKIHFLCSKAIDFEFSQDVKKGKEYFITVPHDNFKDVETFVCIGEIFPDDREDKVSSMFEIRYRVIDSSYVEGSLINFKDGEVLLGRHALHSKIYDGKEWKSYNKQTVVETKEKNIMAVVETYNMRYSYYNF